MVTETNLVTNVVDRMRQVYCGLHGHDNLLQFGRERMYLKCTSCGHETPGWELREAVPPADTDQVRQPALARPQLTGVRPLA